MTEQSAVGVFEPIRIEGVVAEEVGTPRNDGSRGCALYKVPLRLSRSAPSEWAEAFVGAWDRPSRFTSSHRPGIARVYGDRVVLDGTTLEEVRDVHRETLQLAADAANAQMTEFVKHRHAQQAAEEERQRKHREQVDRVAGTISFD